MCYGRSEIDNRVVHDRQVVVMLTLMKCFLSLSALSILIILRLIFCFWYILWLAFPIAVTIVCFFLTVLSRATTPITIACKTREGCMLS